MTVYIRPTSYPGEIDYPMTHTTRIQTAREWKTAGYTVKPDPDGAPAAPGPCAKVRVFCTLVHPDGRRWTGENSVRRAQATCPRGDMPSGSGYELCRDVCDQVGHAEAVALAAAGADAAGCTAYVEGRDFVCYDCQAALVAAGVRHFVLGAPPVEACEDCDGRGHDGEPVWQGYFQPPEPSVCGTCGGTGRAE